MRRNKSKKAEAQTDIIIGCVLAVITIGMVGYKLAELNREYTGVTIIEEEQTEDKIGRIDREEEQDVILDILEQSGVDTDTLDELEKGEDEWTMTTNMKKLVDCSSLHDGEEKFGTYLGLHNRLESMPDYELTRLVIVGDNEFMQGTFDSSDGEKSVLVKLSTTLFADEMCYMYKDSEFVLKKIKNIDVEYSYRGSEDKVHIARFDCKNDKSYVISSVSGLTEEEMQGLVEELLDNLIGMEDWVE